jgi:hypothetical protein
MLAAGWVWDHSPHKVGRWLRHLPKNGVHKYAVTIVVLGNRVRAVRKGKAFTVGTGREDSHCWETLSPPPPPILPPSLIMDEEDDSPEEPAISERTPRKPRSSTRTTPLKTTYVPSPITHIEGKGDPFRSYIDVDAEENGISDEEDEEEEDDPPLKIFYDAIHNLFYDTSGFSGEDDPTPLVETGGPIMGDWSIKWGVSHPTECITWNSQGGGDPPPELWHRMAGGGVAVIALQETRAHPPTGWGKKNAVFSSPGAPHQAGVALVIPDWLLSKLGAKEASIVPKIIDGRCISVSLPLQLPGEKTERRLVLTNVYRPVSEVEKPEFDAKFKALIREWEIGEEDVHICLEDFNGTLSPLDQLG